MASSDPSTLTSTTVSTWTTPEEETTDAYEDVTTTTFPPVDSDYVVQNSGKMAKMG